MVIDVEAGGYILLSHTEVSPALLHLAVPWAPSSAPIWIAHAHLLPADRDYVTIAIGWRNVYGRCPVSTPERRRGYCVCVCEGRARQSDYGLPSPSVVYIPTLSTSWLGLARMTSVFESYEQQFAAITADITVRIGRIPNLTGSKWPTSVTQALLVVTHFGEWRNGITGSLIYTWGTRVLKKSWLSGRLSLFPGWYISIIYGVLPLLCVHVL